MLSLEEAIERSLAATPKLGGETISLANAEGRFAASDAKAKVSLPAFDNSAMDGYAVRSCDLKSATADSPVGLMCVGVIPAGTFPAGSLESETCMKIYTGSPIPDGTDAVIMQEDCRSTPGDGATILCNEWVKPWENIRLQGEDIREGDAVISNGSRITAGTIGLLTASGHDRIEVGRRPRVGLLATGSELTEPPGCLKPGEIYESNRAMLASLAARVNAEPTPYPIVPDSLDNTVAALERAFAENDVVVTSGGVSVGDLDGDGIDDLFLAQNFAAFPTDADRLDAGRGLWLRGLGEANFTPVKGDEAGLKMYGDQRACALADYDGDGRLDLVVTQSGGRTRLFRNNKAKPGLRVRLVGGKLNPDAIGSAARLHFGQALDATSGTWREWQLGSGYGSQDGLAKVLATPKPPSVIEVRWPSGKTTRTSLPAGLTEITLTPNGKILEHKTK